MVHPAMGGRWTTLYYHFLSYALLILFLGIRECWSLNSEGLALLEFRARVDFDPYEALANWNPHDSDPCVWLGVDCVDGNVQTLKLDELSLEGTLAPELGTLSHLRSLILSKNRFSGAIPREIGGLTMLELLDLRGNDLSGTVPTEIGGMLSLKRLFLCDNKFEGSIPLEFGKLNSLTEFQFDENLTSTMATGIGCVNRKFGHCIWQSSLRQLKGADYFIIPIKGALKRYLNALPMFKLGRDSLHGRGDICCAYVSSSSEPHIIPNVQSQVNFVRRRLLEESSNLPALPANGAVPPKGNSNLPSFQSSGSFPAVPNAKKKQLGSSPAPSDPPVQQTHNISAPTPTGPVALPTNQQPSENRTKKIWEYAIIISGVFVLLIVAAVMFVMCRRRGVTTIGPWKTGLSGQLQKAFITGVPKLNRPELETACEDFSNIIDTHDTYTVYKGTLSSGVEIAVASTAVASAKDWSKSSELIYRKKIDTMSRVNHKNFVNLLGYCEEDEPFVRMMVFEYAPNGSLFEHLHVKEVEHLDWNARTRIIMGTAYCLQHMHYDVNPPVAHPNLNSSVIFLTDDYAAKIADVRFWVDIASKAHTSGDNDSNHSELPPLADPETNVYSFGVMLLEIISGKLPYSEEHGPLVNWAADYLNDKRSISYMIDPTLKSFKNNELDVICEVIQDCIQSDPRQRPTMKEVTAKLREVISITPDAATPRLSPLWWAELEILSVEAT